MACLFVPRYKQAPPTLTGGFWLSSLLEVAQGV